MGDMEGDGMVSPVSKTHLRHRGMPACGARVWEGYMKTRYREGVTCERCRRTRVYIEDRAEGHWKPEDYTQTEGAKE